MAQLRTHRLHNSKADVVMNERPFSGRGPLEAAIKLSTAYQAAEGEARHTLLLEILDLLDGLPESSALAKFLIQPARDAMALDPDNAKGLRFRAVKGLLNSGLNDEELSAEAGFDDRAVDGRELQPSLLVDLGRRVASQHLDSIRLKRSATTGHLRRANRVGLR